MSSTIGAEETFRVATQPLADVNGPASYLGWGWLSISLPESDRDLGHDLALRAGHRAPIPEGPAEQMTTTRPDLPVEHDGSSSMWTSRLRRRWMATLPPDKLLPDRQPAYVASWIYVFGVLTLAAFLVILLSGLVLSFAGPAWYHTSSAGRFINSLHFWSVQLFFIFMVIHLWGKFWMAAWRGRRALTWMTGVVCFGLASAPPSPATWYRPTSTRSGYRSRPRTA